MWCSDLFNELLPLCSGCQSPYDMRCCSPQVLPCSHTLCLACVTQDSKVRKSGKRRCLTCDKRYTTFHLNTALGETIERIRVRREALDSQSRRCDECEKRAYLSWMRRCVTCEIQLKEAQLTSVICMECCVDRHNGHALRIVTAENYAAHKEEKVCQSVSVCGSTTSSSTQYRSTISNHSSLHSPSPHMQSASRLHSTSSASSGFSSGGMASSPGGNNPIETRHGIGQKVTSFFSRVASRSGSVPPPQQDTGCKSSPFPPPFQHVDTSSSSHLHKRSVSSHQQAPPPPPPSMSLPLAPTPGGTTRGRGQTMSTFRPPVMGTLSPYMTPRMMGTISLKKSLDDLDEIVRNGEILREETSPFYEGQSLYGVSLLVGGPSPRPSPISTLHSPPSFPFLDSLPSISALSSSTSSSPSQSTVQLQGRSEEKRRQNEMEKKRASLPLVEGDYHRLSPYPARKNPVMLPYAKTSIASGGGGGTVPMQQLQQSPLALANMPRRDPRIRGGPAHLMDPNPPHYENQQLQLQRASFHSAASSTSGRGGEEICSLHPPAAAAAAAAAAATFFDKHKDSDKQVVVHAATAATPLLETAPPQYINVTRSCENLPSQFSEYLGNLDLNNNDGNDKIASKRGGIRDAIRGRSTVLNNLSDHCCSYEYIGS